MALEDLLVPAGSALAGSALASLVIKMMVQNWFRRHEEIASLVQTMLVQLTRIEERVSTLQRTEERTREQDRILAVVQSQLINLKEDVNGVGRKVRSMEQQ